MAENVYAYMESWIATNSKDVADNFRPFVTGKFGKPREMSYTWEYYLKVFCNNVEDDELYSLYDKWEKAILDFCRETGTGFEYATNSGVGLIE